MKPSWAVLCPVHCTSGIASCWLTWEQTVRPGAMAASSSGLVAPNNGINVTAAKGFGSPNRPLPQRWFWYQRGSCLLQLMQATELSSLTDSAGSRTWWWEKAPTSSSPGCRNPSSSTAAPGPETFL